MSTTSTDAGWNAQQAEGLAAAEETYAALVAAGRGDTRAAVDLAGLIYLAFHLGCGATHHRYRKAHGLRPNFYWSSVRGPYASIRLPGGFRLGHRL